MGARIKLFHDIDIGSWALSDPTDPNRVRLPLATAILCAGRIDLIAQDTEKAGAGNRAPGHHRWFVELNWLDERKPAGLWQCVGRRGMIPS